MDAMDMSDPLTLVLVLIGVLALLGMAVVGFIMWRYRIPPRGLIAMFGALIDWRARSTCCLRSYSDRLGSSTTLAL